MRTLAITIQVPEHRHAEFHRMYAAWIEEGESPGPSEWLSPEADRDVASSLWIQMTPVARKVFEACIRNPDCKWEGSVLADEVGLKSPHALAGALSWPVKYAHELGRTFPIRWVKGSNGTTVYWMENSVIRVFKPLL